MLGCTLLVARRSVRLARRPLQPPPPLESGPERLLEGTLLCHDGARWRTAAEQPPPRRGRAVHDAVAPSARPHAATIGARAPQPLKVASRESQPSLTDVRVVTGRPRLGRRTGSVRMAEARSAIPGPAALASCSAASAPSPGVARDRGPHPVGRPPRRPPPAARPRRRRRELQPRRAGHAAAHPVHSPCRARGRSGVLATASRASSSSPRARCARPRTTRYIGSLHVANPPLDRERLLHAPERAVQADLRPGRRTRPPPRRTAAATGHRSTIDLDGSLAARRSSVSTRPLQPDLLPSPPSRRPPLARRRGLLDRSAGSPNAGTASKSGGHVNDRGAG